MNRIIEKYQNASIRIKLMMLYVATIILILMVNLYMYYNIDRMSLRLDDIYRSNVGLNEMLDSLNGVQTSMEEYLNTKTTDAIEAYFAYEQEYNQKIMQLDANTTNNNIKLMERNIRNMSENYLELTDTTIEAKRGRNVEKYKGYYEQASETYKYLCSYINSLNNEQFRNNTGSYQALSKSLHSLEIVSVMIFIMVAVFTILLIFLVTRSITEPLQQLSSAADQVASGQLFQVDVVKVQNMDEIGVVTVAFNQMLVSIRNYIDRIREGMEKERLMQERELRMETNLKDAQLKYLQAQINPHFLFNTLNAGAQLAMMEEADKTYDYIQNVADFFRYNIKKDNDVVSLEDEIHLVDNYIYILNVRFSGDIHFHKEVDENLLRVKIPSMILQPIVENSVNYGIRNIDWEGHIYLKVYEDNQCVCISVTDNGIGIEAEKIEQILNTNIDISNQADDSNGVGLHNVMERLNLFFKGENKFEIESKGQNKGTTVCIKVPYAQGKTTVIS